MNTSALLGTLILVGAVALMIVFMLNKREKDYKAAMEKYERDMEAYNAAVAALNAHPSVTAPAAASYSAPSCEGEVTLVGVDEETAAMVIAILCDELGQNPSALRFKSITAL